MRILIVDDYRMMLRIVRNLLEKLGYSDIDETNNAVEAINKMKSTHYDLIITDWNMTPLSGLEFMQRARAESDLSRTRFLVMSTHSQMRNVKMARDSGAFGFLLKPFDIETLRRKIGLVQESMKGDLEMAK